MKKLIVALIAFLIVQTGFSQVNPNNHYVNGYTKKNGTYVSGYYRTDPNHTINDNYSTYPNVNPYTGKQGTIQPTPTYTTPTYRTPTYTTPTYRTPTYTTPTYRTPTYTTPTYRTPTYTTPTYRIKTYK